MQCYPAFLRASGSSVAAAPPGMLMLSMSSVITYLRRLYSTIYRLYISGATGSGASTSSLTPLRGRLLAGTCLDGPTSGEQVSH